MCMVTTEKKLGSTSTLFSTFYTSPTLIQPTKITYFTNKHQINFLQLTYGDGILFPWASQSADTANWTQECRSQNCTLNSKCNTKVAGGLAAQTCQFHKPCTNLVWCSAQEDQKAWNGPPHQPPSSIHKTVAKSVKRPRSWHNSESMYGTMCKTCVVGHVKPVW